MKATSLLSIPFLALPLLYSTPARCANAEAAPAAADGAQHPDPPAVEEDETDGVANVVGESPAKDKTDAGAIASGTCMKNGQAIGAATRTGCEKVGGKWKATKVPAHE